MNKKFDYDPMQLYVERERTRTLIIEATKDGQTVTTYWRKVLVMFVLGAGVGGFVWMHHTVRGRAFLDAITQDPALRRRVTTRTAPPRPGAEVAKLTENAVDAEDVPAAMLKAQQAKEALGHQLEAVGEGRALPSSVATVSAATGANATAPAPVMYTGNPQPLPSSSLGIANGEKDAPLPITLEQVTDGAQPAPAAPPVVKAPPYRVVNRVPAAYAQQKAEFPDIP